MKLLAIDTSLEACSVGVVPGPGRQPVLRSEILGRGHAERLVGMVEEAMRAAGLAFADLDRIAVTVGPGSFTGLRVGIAAARGFALVVGCPAIGIGTLDIHAETARRIAGPAPVLAVLDARRDEVYCQRFRADGSPSGPPSAARPADLAATVAAGDRLAGSGADLVLAAMPDGDRPAVVHRRSAPEIETLLGLALRAAESGTPPRPLYLRPPDAKPQAAKAVARR